MPNKPSLDQDFPSVARSHALHERAKALIPAQTQTMAKGWQQYVRGISPLYLERGKGAHVWDVDGNEYIDLNMAVGPLVLGYAYDAVDEAIRHQLSNGITFSLCHPLEVEVAELVRTVVPNAEMVRFSKTGADACSAAIRVARAYTQKSKVLLCGYHGWHDFYVSVTDRAAGVPDAVQDLSFTVQYNDIQHVADSIDDDVACVMLEPVVFEAPRKGFLHELRRLCTERGVVLVFDEMWTGFRLSLGGAQTYFDVKPDLAVYSKAVANGMPLSLITGRRDIMRLFEEQVFFFTTFGGEALSLAAAKATLTELAAQNVHEHLFRQGRRLREGYNRIAEALDMPYTRCVGFDCRTMVTFDPTAGSPLELKSLLQQEMLRRGVLWQGVHNMAFTHGDPEVDHVLAAYEDALPVLAEAVREGRVRERLRGDPVGPVFRKTNDFNVKPRRR